MVTEIKNRNYSSPLNFNLVVTKLPHVNFFCQSANIPGIQIQKVEQPNRLVPVKHQGEFVDFQDLRITLKVDEDLKAWLELYEWMVGIGYPQTHKQHFDLKHRNTLLEPNGGLYSDITLQVLSSKTNLIMEVTFVDAWPTSIGELSYRTTDEDVEFITLEATFAYTHYTIRNIK